LGKKDGKRYTCHGLNIAIQDEYGAVCLSFRLLPEETPIICLLVNLGIPLTNAHLTISHYKGSKGKRETQAGFANFSG
jgi:hypothetical protein